MKNLSQTTPILIIDYFSSILRCKYTDETEQVEIYNFSAAVGFEILENSFTEAVQFAKDFVECEGKEYLKVVK